MPLLRIGCIQGWGQTIEPLYPPTPFPHASGGKGESHPTADRDSHVLQPAGTLFAPAACPHPYRGPADCERLQKRLLPFPPPAWGKGLGIEGSVHSQIPPPTLNAPLRIV